MTNKKDNEMAVDSNEVSLVSQASRQLKVEFANPAVMRALIQTTFQAFSKTKNAELLVKQACLEAMINGWTFKDILRKKVYAIPYGNGYSLVQAVGDVRTVAMANGQTGKAAPVYVDDGEKIKTCSVTVYKRGGHENGYTATVYFNEYYKAGYNGKPSNWDTKPRTMIAKVAEMHALRMAFPDKLNQSYIEEEFEKDQESHQTINSKIEEIENKNTMSIGSITKDNNNSHEENTTYVPSEEEQNRILEEEKRESGTQNS